MSHESREGLWKYSKGRFGTTAGQVTDPTCVQRYDAWKTSTVEKLVGSKTKSKVGPKMKTSTSVNKPLSLQRRRVGMPKMKTAARRLKVQSRSLRSSKEKTSTKIAAE